MAELNTECCTPVAQETCCEPSAQGLVLRRVAR